MKVVQGCSQGGTRAHQMTIVQVPRVEEQILRQTTDKLLPYKGEEERTQRITLLHSLLREEACATRKIKV